MDTISRQAAIERLKKEDKILYTTTGLNYLVRAIEELPSVSTEKTGQWFAWKPEDDVWRTVCSECGEETRTLWNYCPHCGAKMEVEK